MAPKLSLRRRMNVADLNAIETRVGAWLAECQPLLDVFTPYTDEFGKFHPNGRDPYLNFASIGLYGIPFPQLFADYEGRNGKDKKLAAKRMRQIAKPPVLGSIYRMAGGGWGWSKKGYKDHQPDCPGKRICECPTIYDRVKTGLWGYAENMGVEMEQDEANRVSRVFRETFPEICGNGYNGQIKGIWVRLEEAVADVMNGKETVRYIGPGNAVKIDKIVVTQSDGSESNIMRMRLPSGRYLHYLDARLENCKMPWKDQEGNDVYRPALVYAGLNQDTKQWETWTQTHGGKLFENLVQGIARDVLAVKLMMFEAMDCPVHGHVHDEGICIVPKDPFSPTVKDMVRVMSERVSWAPTLPLGADGFEDDFYHK